jgi:hypothetical protein
MPAKGTKLSAEARAKISAARKIPQAKCVCLNCGKEFETHQAEVRRGGGKFCNKKCEFEWRTGKPLSKETCDKRSVSLKGRTITWADKISASMKGKPNWRKGLVTPEETKKKISVGNTGKIRTVEDRKKKSDALRGDKCYKWKGGITPLMHQVRYCWKMGVWRDAVFKRDDYRDWYSGVKGNGNLNAHHIVSFASLMERYNIQTLDDALACNALWDVANGVTMIDTVHMAHHSMWGDAE